MLIGAMNHPRRSLREQIKWLGENKFDFLDLTLEAPEAASWTINPREINQMLADAGLSVIGHCAVLTHCEPCGGCATGRRGGAVAMC